MSLGSFFRKLAWLPQRRRKEDDLREELQFHLAQEAEDRQAEGLAEHEARWAARRDLGNVTLLQESTRAMWTWTFFEHLVQDLRYALRTMLANPVFTALAALSLALGIGANTAIFTLLNAVMLKNLPVSKPGELYRLGNSRNCCVLTGLQGDWAIYSYPLYQQFRDHNPEFSEMAAFQGGLQNLNVRRAGASGPAEPYVGEFVSGNYFSMFGLGAFAGRIISPDEDKPNAAPVAVMSYRTWQQHFGLDPSVIGAALNIDNLAFTVIGIAPPGFFGDQLASPSQFRTFVRES